jgi:uncharacterized protein (DUF488 family)
LRLVPSGMTPVAFGGVKLFTIGHSTRTFDEFVELLQSNKVDLVADVRTAPGSRRFPHFAKPALAAELPLRGIAYVHLPELGGLRKAEGDSINTGWRNASFRGFADYMQTDAFETGLDHLMTIAEQHALAIMCAEAVPWRCHRSLIADALTARRVEVLEIIGRGRPRLHTMTPFARVKAGRVYYPPANSA